MSDIINKLNEQVNNVSSQGKNETLSNQTNNNTNGVKIMNDKKKKRDDLGGLTLLLKPTRRLPALVEECLEKGFTISLSKEGYYVSGFYGLNEENQFTGFAFLQETDDSSKMIAFDHKNAKHIIGSFEDLVKFNRHIWAAYFKQGEQYRKPNPDWFEYLLQYGAIEVLPGR